MKKRILAIITTAILTVGTVTAVYAKENNYTNNLRFSRTMMRQSNIENTSTYNEMIDLMRNNGFDAAAKAMENRDYNAINNLLKLQFR